jgi:hypothetical protein
MQTVNLCLLFFQLWIIWEVLGIKSKLRDASARDPDQLTKNQNNIT